MRATAARQGTLREHNLELVLRYVLDASTVGARPPSRADVAAATGLTRATVSALVDRLVQAGLVAELPPAPAVRAGRPAVPLAAPTRTFAAVGAEVNVDYLGARVVDLSGAVLGERQRTGDYRGSDPRTVLRLLAHLVDELVDEVGATAPAPRLVGSALALPGLVDRATGSLLLAPNLGWREVDVVGLLPGSSVLGEHPPQLANEADLAAQAEADARRTHGGAASFLYVSGEVGIGAALVLDGVRFDGRHGWAGEIGHTVVDGERSLEDVAGQDAMLRAAGLDPHGRADRLEEAAAAGEPRALAALEAAGRGLGVALANAVNLLDVPDVVLGGVYARLADHLRGPALDVLRRRVVAGPWATPTVEVAVAHELPAMTGGALTVLERVRRAPSSWLVDEPAPVPVAATAP